MKIRSPWLIKLVSFLAAFAVRLLVGSLRYRYRPLGPNVDPNQPQFQGRYVYAFWHENMLLPAYHYGRRDINVLISQHADGEMIAQTCKHLGFRVVRGSTMKEGRTRGGVEAIRQMRRLAAQGRHLAVTPDGPRGPRRQVQIGLIYLAALTGLPIVPIGFAWQKAWRMRSWDRFAVPVPFSGAMCVTTEPIRVPNTTDREELEHYRRRVQEAMDLATAAAERYFAPAPPAARELRRAA